MKPLTIIASAVLLFAAQPACSQEIRGVTEGGRSILLKDDGTWYFQEDSSENNSKSFRGTSWGMSMEEVEAIEKGKPHRGDRYLAYNLTVADKEAFAMYIFVNDKLVRTKYVFDEGFVNDNNYIKSYKDVKDILTSKYGEPAEDNTIWTDNLYKSDPSDYGRAVSIGHLVYTSKWKEGDTKIFHMLMGEKFKVKHQVEYISISMEALENKALQETNNHDF